METIRFPVVLRCWSFLIDEAPRILRSKMFFFSPFQYAGVAEKLATPKMHLAIHNLILKMVQIVTEPFLTSKCSSKRLAMSFLHQNPTDL